MFGNRVSPAWCPLGQCILESLMKLFGKFFRHGILLFVIFGLLQVGAFAQDETQRVDYLGDPLPEGAVLRLGSVRFSPGSTNDSILSADDQVVVSLGSQTCGWDATTGKRLWTLEVKRDQFETAFMTSAASYGFQPMVRMPKSDRLLLPSGNGQFQFIDFRSGQSEDAFKVKTRTQICSVDVNRDETLFAVGTPKDLIVCDANGVAKFTIENKPAIPIDKSADSEDRLKFGGEFSYARFSPDGGRLVLVNSEKPKTLQVLDPQLGSELKSIATTDRVVRFAFAPGGRLLATTERDIAARLYDLESGTMVWERVFSPPGRDERYTTDVYFSPLENLLAVGTAIGEDQRIHLLDPANGETVGTLTGHTWKPWRVNFSSDGKRLYSTGWDGVIRVWDVQQRAQIRAENSERASSVCTLTQDGRLLAYGDDSGKIHVVDSQSGNKLRTIHVEGFSFAQLAFAADNKTLAAGGSATASIAVFVWNLEQDEPLHRWEWPKGRDVHASITSMSLTPDGKRLAAAVFRQSKCFVFDLPSNRQVAELSHRRLYGLGMHPDGEQLVTAGWDSMVRVWSVNTGEVTHERKHELLQKGDTRMYGVKFSPDQQRIATLNMSGSVSILDLELNALREITLSRSPVYDCFAFSKNGLWLAVGEMGGGATVVDVHSGEQLWVHKCHDNSIYNIEFGPDDRTLLTGGSDGVNYVWDLSQTAKSAEADANDIAANLWSTDGRSAFDAFQYLASRPEVALPAVVASVEQQFATFDSANQDRIDDMIQQFERDEALGEADWNQLAQVGLGTVFAIERVLSDKFAAFEDSDPRVKNLQTLREQLDRRVWALGRAFYLVAIMDSPEAEKQLQKWLSSSPKLNIKKQAFLAKKYRDLWHSRMEAGRE